MKPVVKEEGSNNGIAAPLTEEELQKSDRDLDEICQASQLLAQEKELSNQKMLRYFALAIIIGVSAFFLKFYQGDDDVKAETATVGGEGGVVYENYMLDTKEEAFNNVFNGNTPYVFFCANDPKLHGGKDVKRVNFKLAKTSEFAPSILKDFLNNFELNDEIDDAYIFDKSDIGFAYFNCSKVLKSGKNLYQKFDLHSDVSPQIGVYMPWTALATKRVAQASRRDMKNLAHFELFMEYNLFPKPSGVMTTDELKSHCQADSKKKLCIAFMKGANYSSLSADNLFSAEERYEAQVMKKYPQVRFIQINATIYHLSVESENVDREFDFEVLAMRQNYLYAKMDYTVKSIEDDVDGYAKLITDQFLDLHVADAGMKEVKGNKKSPLELKSFYGLTERATKEQCSSMRVSQLKEHLKKNGLSCDGCTEKKDFVKACENEAEN